MRPLHRAGVDKLRPVLLLTPVEKLPFVSEVTVAPISTGQVRYSTQVCVGTEHGLDHDSVVRCESITTIPRSFLGAKVGELTDGEEWGLRDAVLDAFALLPTSIT